MRKKCSFVGLVELPSSEEDQLSGSSVDSENTSYVAVADSEQLTEALLLQ